MKRIFIALFVFYAMVASITSVYGQSEDAVDTVIVVNELQQYLRLVDVGAEYYSIDKENEFIDYHILYQPLISKRDVITFEIGIVQSWLSTGNVVSPGDVSISYRRNIIPKKDNEIGYKGMAVILKSTMPTGRSEYYSGFNSWTIEPSLGQQWAVFSPDFYVGYQVRYNYSYGSLPDSRPRDSFFRVDIHIGYENTKFWLFLNPDYRLMTSNGSNTFLFGFDAGYKLSNNFGLKLIAKPRVSGNNFYEQHYLLGLYKYL